MKTYYTMFVRWEEGDPWTPEFGDYELETVRQELFDSYTECRETKIVAHDEDTDIQVMTMNMNADWDREWLETRGGKQ